MSRWAFRSRFRLPRWPPPRRVATGACSPRDGKNSRCKTVGSKRSVPSRTTQGYDPGRILGRAGTECQEPVSLAESAIEHALPFRRPHGDVHTLSLDLPPDLMILVGDVQGRQDGHLE